MQIRWSIFSPNFQRKNVSENLLLSTNQLQLFSSAFFSTNHNFCCFFGKLRKNQDFQRNTLEILQKYFFSCKSIFQIYAVSCRIYDVFESFHNLSLHFLNYFSYSAIIFSKVLQKTAVLSKYVGNTSYILRKYAVYLEYSCGAVRHLSRNFFKGM